MILRTYERCSTVGRNRLTRSVNFLAVGDRMEASLTASGGSRTLFWKINTFGELALMVEGIEVHGDIYRG